MGKKPDRDDELDAARRALVARKFAWLAQVNADRELKPHSAVRVAAAIIEITRVDPDLSPEDHFCWPSIETLGDKAGGLSRRTVQEARTALQTRGHLHVDEGGGRHKSNRYYMVLAGEKPRENAHPFQSKPCENAHPSDAETVRGSAGNGADLRRKRCEDPHPTPSYDSDNDSIRARKRAHQEVVFDEDLGIRPEVAHGYVEHRKAKRAALTERALALICTQLRAAKAAGIDPNDALDTAVRSGWQGFNADWLKPRDGRTKQTPQTAQERDDARMRAWGIKWDPEEY